MSLKHTTVVFLSPKIIFSQSSPFFYSCRHYSTASDPYRSLYSSYTPLNARLSCLLNIFYLPSHSLVRFGNCRFCFTAHIRYSVILSTDRYPVVISVGLAAVLHKIRRFSPRFVHKRYGFVSSSASPRLRTPDPSTCCYFAPKSYSPCIPYVYTPNRRFQGIQTANCLSHTEVSIAWSSPSITACPCWPCRCSVTRPTTRLGPSDEDLPCTYLTMN